MTDPEIDGLLRRYRPAGPPPELRARVVADALPRGRVWPWAAAAAALLCVTLGLQIARLRIDRPTGGLDDGGAAAEMQMLAELLGGDVGVDEARRILWQRQLAELVDESRRPRERPEQW